MEIATNAIEKIPYENYIESTEIKQCFMKINWT